MKIDKNHPRFTSLAIREKLVQGVEKGITSQAGLIAHGRGEAFDYLLGEKTQDFATQAIQAAACSLLLARKPILSINGNAVALSAQEFVHIARYLSCKIEVNLFHFTRKREQKIESYLKELDPNVVLSSKGRKALVLPRVASRRRIVLREGIGQADTVFVPLEDGDRCQALAHLGKTIITVDLNPLSRTAQSATITIVDHIARALPHLSRELRRCKKFTQQEKRGVIRRFNNKKNLTEALQTIQKNFNQFS